MIDLTDRVNLLECVAVLVDAMRRADPEFCAAHGLKVVTDEDWDTAIEAGENVLEAAQVEYWVEKPDGSDKRGVWLNAARACLKTGLEPIGDSAAGDEVGRWKSRIAA